MLVKLEVAVEADKHLIETIIGHLYNNNVFMIYIY